MTKEKLMCSSCKKNIVSAEGTARFNCPNCGKFEIVRCLHCRGLATKYTCPLCNFEGPN